MSLAGLVRGLCSMWLCPWYLGRGRLPSVVIVYGLDEVGCTEDCWCPEGVGCGESLGCGGFCCVCVCVSLNFPELARPTLRKENGNLPRILSQICTQSAKKFYNSVGFTLLAVFFFFSFFY